FDPRCKHILRSCRESVLPAIHRSCARVIGKPANDAIPAINTNDPLHYADWDLVLVEVRALFDVQFEISRQSATRDASVRKLCGILSVTTQPVRQRQSLLVFHFKNFSPA